MIFRTSRSRPPIHLFYHILLIRYDILLHPTTQLQMRLVWVSGAREAAVLSGTVVGYIRVPPLAIGMVVQHFYQIW